MNRMLQHKREDSKAVESKYNSHGNPKDDNVVMTPSSQDEFLAPLMSSIMMIGTREKEESKDDQNRYFSFQQTLSSQMRQSLQKAGVEPVDFSLTKLILGLDSNTKVPSGSWGGEKDNLNPFLEREVNSNQSSTNPHLLKEHLKVHKRLKNRKQQMRQQHERGDSSSIDQFQVTHDLYSYPEYNNSQSLTLFNRQHEMGTMKIMDQQEEEDECENHNESLEELVTHSDDGLNVAQGPPQPLQQPFTHGLLGSQRIDLANVKNPQINEEYDFNEEEDLQLSPSGASSPLFSLNFLQSSQRNPIPHHEGTGFYTFNGDGEEQKQQ